MINGLIKKLENLDELRRIIMRPLTEEEVNIILEHDVDYFIHEELGMNDKEYEGLKKIRKIISAYCTKSEEDYEKELEGDIQIPYYALKTIVNDMEDRLNVKDSSKKTCEPSVEEKANSLRDILNMIPKSADNWIKCYVKYVKDHRSVLDVLKSDHSGYTTDEKVGDVLDAIKDATIDACIDELRKTGEIELDSEIMSEVTSKLWHSEDNIRINIVNNKLKVEFK